MGQGTGELYIKSSVSDLSDTVNLIDAYYYNPNTLTSSQTINISNLPTNFKCKFKVNVVDASVLNTAWLEVGSNNNNCLLFGNTGSYKTIGIFVKVNGSYVVSDSRNDVLPINNWQELTYIYNNGVHTLTDGINTITLNNSQITARDYVYFRNETNQIKEILFLPL